MKAAPWRVVTSDLVPADEVWVVPAEVARREPDEDDVAWLERVREQAFRGRVGRIEGLGEP